MNTKDIMIPVTKTTFNIMFYALLTLLILFYVYFIHFVIGSFIKFLIEIATGDPFSLRNIKRLKFITLNLLLIPSAIFILNLIMPLIFHQYFTDDIKLNPEAWKNLGLPFLLFFIFMALYIAFKKGRQLKEENDLTV